MADDDLDYDAYIARMRQEEYPMLKDGIYLDHAGTSLPNKTTMDLFHAEMLSQLHGNTHSTSSASQKTSQAVTDVRSRLLSFFNASPDAFDLVFTANATAGIKLVAEALRDHPRGFEYGYHVASHTSLVGARELAVRSCCIHDEGRLLTWHSTSSSSEPIKLFAYPAQSNMNGRRLPLTWCKQLRERYVYTMLDAAGYTPTAKLDLNQVQPDFTVVSLSKIFGFPDLGALIIRKESAHLLRHRRYFGGGTVDMVLCDTEQWHVKREESLHEQLEDGSLPIHNVLALRSAMDAHTKLFDSIDRISKHTLFLVRRLHSGLKAFKHANGASVAAIYHKDTAFRSGDIQGPTLAFNLKDIDGQWISTTEVDKLASVRNIHLRTGGVCNPGGIMEVLSLEPWEMRQNHLAGFRCGGTNDVFNGKPTGIIRVSLGPMSTTGDVDSFLAFLEEYFVEQSSSPAISLTNGARSAPLHVESLIVYPIKSCAGWQIPDNMTWDVRSEGLAWDREWCILHAGTGNILSQKSYPRMALIRPQLDFKNGKLLIKLGDGISDVEVPLSLDPRSLAPNECELASAQVCDDKIQARRYTSPFIAEKLSRFLGVQCTLARFPVSTASGTSARHRKQHLNELVSDERSKLLLSNESPILTITRSSLNALNEFLKAKGQRAAHHSVFRANIILTEPPQHRPGSERPWIEDSWQTLRMRSADASHSVNLISLGGCRRCQMVCVDQLTAEKRSEIFLMLAKHRRIAGRVMFGIHTALHESTHGRIAIGDLVDTV